MRFLKLYFKAYKDHFSLFMIFIYEKIISQERFRRFVCTKTFRHCHDDHERTNFLLSLTFVYLIVYIHTH